MNICMLWHSETVSTKTTYPYKRLGYRYHKIRKAFSKFYHRHSEFIAKYNIGLKTLLQLGISELIFYGDLVYKFKRIIGKLSKGAKIRNRYNQ